MITWQVEFIQQYIWYIYAAYITGFVALILWISLKYRGKIGVRIKGSIPERVKWVKPIPGKTELQMEKPKGKYGAGWRLKYKTTCIIRKKGMFGLKTYDLIEAWPDAEEALIQEEDVPYAEQCHWTRKNEEKLFEANVVKAAGATTQKFQMSMAIYVLIGIAIIIGILNLLTSTGMIRLGR
jgi:hypothetical protein